MRRAQFLWGLPCVPRAEVGLGDVSEQLKLPSNRSYFMQKSAIADYPPQIRDVTGGGGMEWWFIRGAVCRFSPKQESWLNWRSIEVVK